MTPDLLTAALIACSLAICAGLAIGVVGYGKAAIEYGRVAGRGPAYAAGYCAALDLTPAKTDDGWVCVGPEAAVPVGEP